MFFGDTVHVYCCIAVYRLPTFTHLIKQIVQSSLYTKMTV